ncbi:protein B4 [Mugil cephalus]|uniref:protein B4 n=1 Tax=Mugil cephalus TaxID=48193 RepID=UPI001FB7A598|nr:protein B4 [Mugil cephalus]
MPPKKSAAEAPAQSSSDVAVEETDEKAPGAAAVRKIAAHPSTAIMVKEALKELDSRKGVSSQAIQNYIKQKYPSVDSVRLKYLVRKALKKGIENGTLVRPANSSVTTGATGKFRLAPKVKESKPKGENADPNVQKSPKAAKGKTKDGAKKSKKAGATKKTDAANEQTKSPKDLKPPKKSKKNDEALASKVAPAKKPKAKKAEAGGDGEGTKTKAAKKTKEGKPEKASQSKATKAGSDVPSKATGKRAKKAAD